MRVEDSLAALEGDELNELNLNRRLFSKATPRTETPFHRARIPRVAVDTNNSDKNKKPPLAPLRSQTR